VGNLFIGFPVPRAKIADMITGSAPPLNHVANHLPVGTDPLVLPGDISSDQVVQWNGTKFVGTDPPSNGGYPSPLSIHASHFFPKYDEVDFYCSKDGLRKTTTLDAAKFSCPVFLPHGVTVTKLTLYAYCSLSGSVVDIDLYRITNVGGSALMATCHSDWIDGNGSIYDDSIDDAVIDNTQYCYMIYAGIEPDTSAGNAILRSVKIDFA